MVSHECADCTVFFDKDEIARKLVTEEMIGRATVWHDSAGLLPDRMPERQNKIIKIGIFSLNGWVGCGPFYLFQCCHCGKFNVDYAHGYTSDGTHRGLIYLSYSDCMVNLVLYQKRFYKDNNKRQPFSLFQIIRNLL